MIQWTPITENGLRYNHLLKEAHIGKVVDGEYLVVFREEVGVFGAVWEIWYPSEVMAMREINKFIDTKKEESETIPE